MDDQHNQSSKFNGNATINIPNVLPTTTDMNNAQIFSQQDVIAYLERKGLSVDTIKRLQIYDHKNKEKQHIESNPDHNNNNNNNNNNKINSKQISSSKENMKSNIPSSTKHRKKSAKHSNHNQHIKYVSLSTNKYVFNIIYIII